MRSCSRVTGTVWDRLSGASNLAMPKSSSFGVPSPVTRIFAALMSRCTTRLRCANCTAAQTWTKSSMRSRMNSVRRRNSRRWIRHRRVPSPDKGYRPRGRRCRSSARSTDEPSVARICRSLCNRLRRRGCKAAWCRTLMATVSGTARRRVRRDTPCSCRRAREWTRPDSGRYAYRPIDPDVPPAAIRPLRQSHSTANPRSFHRTRGGIRPSGGAPHPHRTSSPSRAARFGRAGVDHLLEQRLDLLPARVRHHAGGCPRELTRGLPTISLSNQARASRISRCTVAVDAPPAAAIWS